MRSNILISTAFFLNLFFLSSISFAEVPKKNIINTETTKNYTILHIIKLDDNFDKEKYKNIKDNETWYIYLIEESIIPHNILNYQETFKNLRKIDDAEKSRDVRYTPCTKTE